MSDYSRSQKLAVMPRLPLRGRLDLTYRCNNNCRHCWLRISPGGPEKQEELSLEEIVAIVDQARSMGCRRWFISGGEPMLRPDFPEILDYIIRRSVYYSLNTNGTLITPEIARLLRAKGDKVVALYGATADVHDHVTRNPGSYEATMRGYAYLKEADADFIVQIVPMRDNYHQFEDMVRLAESLGQPWRVGADWLFLSACGDPERNQEIARQRLDPQDVIALDHPDLDAKEWRQEEKGDVYRRLEGDDRLFASCIATHKVFHIDPYGQMTFCSFVKDPALRYDLRQGSFQDCWDNYIPSLADRVRGGQEYLENCAACELQDDCRWCPVYGYLEHRRLSAPVEYLCAVAEQARRFREDWYRVHRRYYRVAGITIQVDTDLPIADDTFHPDLEPFRVDGPGEDTIRIHHYFSLPDLDDRDLGREVYRKPPWAIYRKGNSWVYLGIPPATANRPPYRVAVFNRDHTRARIYNGREETFRKGALHALTLFPSDQILLARLLADRQGCFLHSSGVVLDGQGLLFVGHSDAGKSTMVKMLQDHAEILCDDRMIVRRRAGGFRIYGNWSHGEVPLVSPNSAPLRAIMFLEQAAENRLASLDDRKAILRRLLACLIKPFVTADWWEKSLALLEEIAREVPCYTLRFDKSGEVVDVLKDLCAAPAPLSAVEAE